MLLNENWSNKSWQVKKVHVDFQAMETVHLVYFLWIKDEFKMNSHREYLGHWKSKQINEHGGYSFPKNQCLKQNIYFFLMTHQAPTLWKIFELYTGNV